jgi:hypothetical protein
VILLIWKLFGLKNPEIPKSQNPLIFSGMDNIPENNLFEITLSREGVGWLLRLYKVTRWLLILGIIVSLLLILSLILRYRIYMRYNIPYNWITNVDMNILPIFEGVIMIVTIIQLYYFFTFSRTAQKAIEQQ